MIRKEIIELYPNPRNGMLYIHADGNIQHEIYEVSGKLMKSGKFDNKEIDVLFLIKGKVVSY